MNNRMIENNKKIGTMTGVKLSLQNNNAHKRRGEESRRKMIRKVITGQGS